MKPRGMHWQTYRRLCEEAEEAQAAADNWLVESLSEQNPSTRVDAERGGASTTCTSPITFRWPHVAPRRSEHAWAGPPRSRFG